jgi:lipopolysaccharide biosynthesis glycosyltransferase
MNLLNIKNKEEAPKSLSIERPVIHLCMCADDNVIEYVGVVIASAVYFTPADIHIHLIHPINLKDADVWRSRFLIAGATQVKMYPAKWSRKGYSGLKHVNETTMLRILIPSLLTSVNRVLYLDTDTLICSSLLPIINDTLTGPWGIALKSSIHPHWEIRNGVRSGNVGVMLWDLDVARACNFQEHCMSILDKNPSLHDQHVINDVLKGQYGNLVPEANVFMNQDDNILDNYIIFHFAGYNKPWNRDCLKLLPWEATLLWQAFAYSLGISNYYTIISEKCKVINGINRSRGLQQLASIERDIAKCMV